MTTPDNPYGNPGQTPPPPAYGAPQYGAQQGQPAPYGQAPQGQPAPYGQAPYGQAPYGQAPQGNFGGTLASWPLRVGSFLLDAIIAGILGWIIIIAGAAANSGALVGIGYLVALAGVVYNLVRQGKTGQTVGKQICGTYLVREADGQFVGAGLSIGREILHIVDGIPCYLGYLWPLWDAKKQTFADKIVSTVVVKR